MQQMTIDDVKVETTWPVYNQYEAFKKYEVKTGSIEDFHNRYHRPSCYLQRGKEYVAAILNTSREELAKYGFCIISRHASVTGEVVAYYEK